MKKRQDKMDEDASQYPKEKSQGDAIHTIARATAGMIPIAGAPVTELLNLIVTPPLEKKRSEWFEQIGQRLRELEEKKGISLEELRKNEKFIDIAIQATQVALRTSQQEKGEALRNAILKAASPDSPDLYLSLQQMFINYIDSFTVWHIKILDLFSDPPRWAQRNNHKFHELMMSGLSNILEEAFPELSGRRDFYDQIWKDLYSRGLVNTEGLHTTMTGSGLMAKRASAIGEMFIQYITE